MEQNPETAGWNHAYETADKSARPFSNGDMVPTGNDAAWFAEFYMGKVPNFDGTDYSEVPHIRLKLAGDNNRVYDQPAIMESTPSRPSDIERFPAQWRAFQLGLDPTTRGTLLTDWDKCEPGDVRRLEMQGITTIQQLAHLGDAQVQNIMGARALRDLARQHLGAGADAEKDEMRAEMVKMSTVLSGLMGMLTDEQRAELAAKAAAAGGAPAPAKPARGAKAA